MQTLNASAVLTVHCPRHWPPVQPAAAPHLSPDWVSAAQQQSSGNTTTAIRQHGKQLCMCGAEARQQANYKPCATSSSGNFCKQPLIHSCKIYTAQAQHVPRSTRPPQHFEVKQSLHTLLSPSPSFEGVVWLPHTASNCKHPLKPHATDMEHAYY